VPVYPGDLASRAISSGGKPQTYKKEATNEWTFSMPAGDVIISAAVSQTPIKSSELATLDVSVSAAVTPKLLSNNYNYTADIPHIIPTAATSEEDEDQSDGDDDSDTQTFSIIAIPEDPQAAVTITKAGGEPSDSGEYELTEGATVYTITVEREGVAPPINTYNFTVSYWPDITLASIELSSSENSNWTHKIPVQDKQEITVPYNIVTITASSDSEDLTLSASGSGAGTLTPGETGKWTLKYTDSENDTYSVSSEVCIKSSKTIGAVTYEKEYVLNITKIVDDKYPLKHWATSSGANVGVSIIKDGDQYYEAHTFLSSGTLSIDAVPDADDSLSARALVVAGGGGGGSNNHNPNSGNDQGGGGGGGVAYSKAAKLSKEKYFVVVGLGGTSQKNNAGVNGGDSSLGTIVTAIGGGGGGRGSGTDTDKSNGSLDGKDGGSGGGGAAGSGNYQGDPGKALFGTEVTGWTFHGNDGSKGSEEQAGGDGGSANFTNNISGTMTEYAKGGKGNAGNAPAESGTGNGGGGSFYNNTGNNSIGGNGGSGIVIVRFPARPN
jgi:hypothetical protein